MGVFTRGLAAAFLLATLAVFGVSGCAGHGTPSPARRVHASPPGEYAAGRTVDLADGLTLTVPPGGLVTLGKPGALVAGAASETGGEIDSAPPRWGTGLVQVYSKIKDFDGFVARDKATYAMTRAHRLDHDGQSVAAWSSQPTVPGVKATAHIYLYSQPDPVRRAVVTFRRDVILMLQPPGQYPSTIEFEIAATAPPGSALASAPPAELPEALVRYLNLRLQ